jgi:hypothetical protein
VGSVRKVTLGWVGLRYADYAKGNFNFPENVIKLKFPKPSHSSLAFLYNSQLSLSRHDYTRIV